MKQQAFDCCTF